MVIVPTCCVLFVLAATLYWTVPLPEPLLPEVIVMNDGSLLAAVHAHPLDAETLTLPGPPAASNTALVGLIEYRQLVLTGPSLTSSLNTVPQPTPLQFVLVPPAEVVP